MILAVMDIRICLLERGVIQVFTGESQKQLFLNDGKGRFKLIEESKSSGIADIGMVCGAVHADLTGDGKDELVIVGEWMTPENIQFQSRSF